MLTGLEIKLIVVAVILLLLLVVAMFIIAYQGKRIRAFEGMRAGLLADAVGPAVAAVQPAALAAHRHEEPRNEWLTDPGHTDRLQRVADLLHCFKGGILVTAANYFTNVLRPLGVNVQEATADLQQLEQIGILSRPLSGKGRPLAMDRRDVELAFKVSLPKPTVLKHQPAGGPTGDGQPPADPVPSDPSVAAATIVGAEPVTKPVEPTTAGNAGTNGTVRLTDLQRRALEFLKDKAKMVKAQVMKALSINTEQYQALRTWLSENGCIIKTGDTWLVINEKVIAMLKAAASGQVEPQTVAAKPAAAARTVVGAQTA